MTAAQKEVLAKHPAAKCRKHRQTAWFSVGLNCDDGRWRIIGSGASRGKAWQEAADRLQSAPLV